jgi:hypothetical protein
MAATYTSVPGPMGGGSVPVPSSTGPEAWGTYGVDIIKVVIDAGAMTSLTPPTKLRYVDWVMGVLASNVAIDNSTSPPTITLTIPSTASVTSFLFVGGRGR